METQQVKGALKAMPIKTNRRDAEGIAPWLVPAGPLQIANLAVWFGLHVVVGEMRIVTTLGLRLDMPVWSTLDITAAALVIASLVPVFRFQFGTLTVLAGSAVAGLILKLALDA